MRRTPHENNGSDTEDDIRDVISEVLQRADVREREVLQHAVWEAAKRLDHRGQKVQFETKQAHDEYLEAKHERHEAFCSEAHQAPASIEYKAHQAQARRLKRPDYYAVVDQLRNKCASCERHIHPMTNLYEGRKHRSDIACSGCMTARYCGRSCLLEHWFAFKELKGHKEVCKQAKDARKKKQQGIRGASKKVRQATRAVGDQVLQRWAMIQEMMILEQSSQRALAEVSHAHKLRTRSLKNGPRGLDDMKRDDEERMLARGHARARAKGHHGREMSATKASCAPNQFY